MQKSIAIIFIFLITNSYTSSLFDQYPINFSEQRSIMTVMTQVEASMKSGAPLDAVQKMLSEFVRAVTQEQIQHDRLYSAQQTECESEFSFRLAEIQDAESAHKASSERLEGCHSQNSRATADLHMCKQELQQLRSYQEIVLDSRRRDQKAFEDTTMAFQRVSQAVTEAINILEEIWNGSSNFIQLRSHANKMLKDSVKIRKVHLLAPIMNALVEISKSNLEDNNMALQRLKSMLFAYSERVQNEYEQQAAAETEAVNQFLEIKARVDQNIAHLEQQQLELEEEITDLGKCIITQSGIKSSAAAKRDRNKKLFDDATALCTSVEQEYKNSTDARRQELSLLSQIKERVEMRFSQMSEGVKHRGLQDRWESHNNYVGLIEEP